MELMQAMENLQEDSTFLEWKASHKDSYLSHAFNMFDNEQKEWQLGFYQKKSGKITTFIINPDDVTVRPEEEVFKHEEKDVKELKLPKDLLSLSEIVSKAAGFQQQKYPKDRSMKIIALLQNIDPHGIVWNITCVTQAFNTLNMKIHPTTGDVMEHKLSSVFSFRSKDA